MFNSVQLLNTQLSRKGMKNHMLALVGLFTRKANSVI